MDDALRIASPLRLLGDPLDAKIVVGAVAPASPDPVPIVLLPGFEYRMRGWRHPNTNEVHWLLERRKSTPQVEDDE